MRTNASAKVIAPMGQANRDLLAAQLRAAAGVCALTIEYDGRNLWVKDSLGSVAGTAVKKGKPYQSLFIQQQWIDQQMDLKQCLAALEDSILEIDHWMDDKTGGYTSYY